MKSNICLFSSLRFNLKAALFQLKMIYDGVLSDFKRDAIYLQDLLPFCTLSHPFDAAYPETLAH